MYIGTMKKGNYHVYCSEGDPWNKFNNICALEMVMFEPPDEADPDWKPLAREDVELFCSKSYTAEEVYEKIKVLQKKLISELQKDTFSLKHFEK